MQKGVVWAIPAEAKINNGVGADDYIRPLFTMREISTEKIKLAVKEACIKANKELPRDLEEQIKTCTKQESSEPARSVMCTLCENLDAAREMDIPICQDTGMVVVFCKIGQDVHIVDGSFEKAINEGIALGYEEGLLRKSVVGDPLNRINTNDNTPAVIHTEIVDGDKLSITVAPKGFGSENMSKLKMFTPFATREDIINFVVDTVKTAGSNPCPPIVLGVGIGGNFEKCAFLAKKALCRNISVPNPDKFYAEMEKEILERVNLLNIGPQGFGGKTTALGVMIETFPTHIAGLPVAVNVGCHVTRHFSVEI